MTLHHRIFTVIISSCISLAFTSPIQAETGVIDHHNHDTHAASGLSLDHGKKWQTDAPLRKGMQSINDAVKKAVPAFHHDVLTSKEAEQLAKQVNDQVTYLVTNCKLEPQADAVLHVLIGELLSSAEKLSKDPLSNRGMPGLVKVLQLYPVYFDHQGWKGVTDE